MMMCVVFVGDEIYLLRIILFILVLRMFMQMDIKKEGRVVIVVDFGFDVGGSLIRMSTKNNFEVEPDPMLLSVGYLLVNVSVEQLLLGGGIATGSLGHD